MEGENEFITSNTLFFLGAGFSASAGVPMTFAFVEKFQDYLNENKKELSIEFHKLLEIFKKTQIRDKEIGILPDIEFVYEILHRRLDYNNELILAFFENYKGILDSIPSDIVEKLIVELKYFIKKKTNVNLNSIIYLKDFQRFFDSNEIIEIFTTNYDNTIEQFCSNYGISYTDGFDLEWNRSILEELKYKLKLYKIHGSIGWYQTTTGKYLKIPIDFEQYCDSCRRKIPVLRSGEILEDMIMYPMQKWERPGPLLDLMYILKQRLLSSNTEIVISIGYSFRDDYIKTLFIESLKRNPSLHIFIISPSADKIKKVFLTEENLELNTRIIPITSYLEDILHILNNIRFYYKQALKDEEECYRNLRHGGRPNWNSTVDRYISSFHFEKVLNTFNNDDDFLFDRNFTQKIEIAFKLIIGLYSLNLKEEAHTIKKQLFGLYEVFIEGLILEIYDLKDEVYPCNLSSTVSSIDRNSRRKEHIIRTNDFQGIERSLSTLNFLKNRYIKKMKNENTQKFNELKSMFEFLEVTSIIYNFWNSRILNKELLEEHYGQINEKLGIVIRERNDLDKIFPIEDNSKAEKEILENEKNIFRTILDHYFFITDKLDKEEIFRKWKL